MQDTISRQAAIDAVIKHLQLDYEYAWGVREAINALPPAQPEINCSEIPNNSDTISRQAAIHALTEYGRGRAVYIGVEEAVRRIEQLPPIQQKKGRWIKLDMHRGMADHKCTACKQECYVPTCMGEPMYAFCPNCGAEMEVTE